MQLPTTTIQYRCSVSNKVALSLCRSTSSHTRPCLCFEKAASPFFWCEPCGGRLERPPTDLELSASLRPRTLYVHNQAILAADRPEGRQKGVRICLLFHKASSIFIGFHAGVNIESKTFFLLPAPSFAAPRFLCLEANHS